MLTVPDGDHLTLLNVYNQYIQSEFHISCVIHVPIMSKFYVRHALPVATCTRGARQCPLSGHVLVLGECGNQMYGQELQAHTKSERVILAV
jgi:hypothetical protein